MGKSSVVRFNVTDQNGTTVGRIKIINTVLSSTQGAKFVCYTKGYHKLLPGKTYNLVFSPVGGTGAIFIKNGVANNRGNIHMVGALTSNFLNNVLPNGGSFSLVPVAP